MVRSQVCSGDLNIKFIVKSEKTGTEMLPFRVKSELVHDTFTSNLTVQCTCGEQTCNVGDGALMESSGEGHQQKCPNMVNHENQDVSVAAPYDMLSIASVNIGLKEEKNEHKLNDLCPTEVDISMTKQENTCNSADAHLTWKIEESCSLVKSERMCTIKTDVWQTQTNIDTVFRDSTQEAKPEHILQTNVATPVYYPVKQEHITRDCSSVNTYNYEAAHYHDYGTDSRISKQQEVAVASTGECDRNKIHNVNTCTFRDCHDGPSCSEHGECHDEQWSFVKTTDMMLDNASHSQEIKLKNTSRQSPTNDISNVARKRVRESSISDDDENRDKCSSTNKDIQKQSGLRKGSGKSSIKNGTFRCGVCGFKCQGLAVLSKHMISHRIQNSKARDTRSTNQSQEKDGKCSDIESLQTERLGRIEKINRKRKQRLRNAKNQDTNSIEKQVQKVSGHVGYADADENARERAALHTVDRNIRDKGHWSGVDLEKKKQACLEENGALLRKESEVQKTSISKKDGKKDAVGEEDECEMMPDSPQSTPADNREKDKYECITDDTNEPNTCKWCDATFEEPESLKKHMMRIESKEIYPCSFCTREEINPCRLAKHVKSHQREKKHCCPVCGKRFSWKGCAQRHMKTHTGEKAYKCDTCEKAFKDSCSLRTHIKTIHEKSHNDVSGKQRNIGSNGKFRCHFCDIKFVYEAHFERHLAMHSTHSGDQKHKCCLCGQTFNERHLLHGHMKIHTGEKPYKCEICEERFTKNGLKIHMQKCHRANEKTYKCDVCDESFYNSKDKDLHMIDHTKIFPFNCAHCSKGFKLKGNLKLHLRIHTGEKPLKCAECSGTFLYHKQLQVHMVKHTGVLPYACVICGKKFSLKGVLNQHMRSHDKQTSLTIEKIRKLSK